MGGLRLGWPVWIGVVTENLQAQRRFYCQVTEIEGGPDSGQYWCYFRDPEGNVFEVAQQL